MAHMGVSFNQGVSGIRSKGRHELKTCRRTQCLSWEGGHLAQHFLSSDAYSWQLGCNVEA